MIITLIFLGLLILSFVLHCLNEEYWLSDIIYGFIIVFSVIGTVGSVVCGLIIAMNFGFQEIYFNNTVYEKQVLEYRLEQQDNIAGNELLYKDITEFNNSLRSTKRLANNPWTSWFDNQKVAELDYIEIPAMGEDVKK